MEVDSSSAASSGSSGATTEAEVFERGWNWNSWYSYLLIINAICGIVCVEIAWARTSLFREMPEDFQNMFPAYRRVDTHKWRKWRCYIGGATVLLPRLIFGILLLLVLALCVKIAMIGQRFHKPIVGCRKAIVLFFYKFTARSILLVTFWTWRCKETYCDPKKGEVDYTPYLGAES